MRAARVTTTDGPEAVTIDEVPEPTPEESAGQVVLDVRAVGLSFPDLLLSRGEYQVRPETPFTLGVDLSGVVRSAPDGSGLAAGDRVAAVLPYGGAAEVVAVGTDAVFPLPEALSFEQGAAVPMNYLTAHFALADRGGVGEGDTVLVTGAAGGVGTATIQVAKGLGARSIALVSTEAKAEVAHEAGADEVVVGEGFRDRVKELTEGRGVDAVLDVVGGEITTDLLRSLAPLGRLLVVGFAAGSIPQVRVNRLLLNNVDVRGVGWGAYAMVRPGFMRRQWEALVPMIEAGVVAPPIGATYPLEQVGQALQEMQDRATLGKSVIVLENVTRP